MLSVESAGALAAARQKFNFAKNNLLAVKDERTAAMNEFVLREGVWEKRLKEAWEELVTVMGSSAVSSEAAGAVSELQNETDGIILPFPASSQATESADSHLANAQ